MRKLLISTSLLVIFVLSFAFPGVASVKYDVAESVIGDAGAFPVKRDFVEGHLGKPDFVQEAVGFPSPMEVYVVEDSEELSHIFLIYGAGEGGNESYAMGVAMKGIDLGMMLGMIQAMAGEDAQKMVILQGENFAVLDLVGGGMPQVLWAFFEERSFQNEKRLVSFLIPPANLVPYFAVAYQDFEESLKKAIAERITE